MEQSHPQCTCTHFTEAHLHGTVQRIEGHVAVTLVKVQDLDGATLHPEDPLPIPGGQAR